MILHKKDLARTTSMFLDLIRIDLLQKKIRVRVRHEAFIYRGCKSPQESSARCILNRALGHGGDKVS